MSEVGGRGEEVELVVITVAPFLFKMAADRMVLGVVLVVAMVGGAILRLTCFDRRSFFSS